MPPTKRKAEQPPAAAASPARVTRSSAKLVARGSGAAGGSAVEFPEKKETKKIETKKANGKQQKKKKNEKINEVEGGGSTAETDEGSVVDASNKIIVIEHCKQCNSFKTRANLVKEGLEKRTAGITVILNPEKPRRGCFEIREEGGKKFISLLDMKRPFKPMKDLDMDKVISDIIDEISSTG